MHIFSTLISAEVDEPGDTGVDSQFWFSLWAVYFKGTEGEKLEVVRNQRSGLDN